MTEMLSQKDFRYDRTSSLSLSIVLNATIRTPVASIYDRLIQSKNYFCMTEYLFCGFTEFVTQRL